MGGNSSRISSRGGGGGGYIDLFGYGVEKANDSNSECLNLDSANYEDKINQVEIPHERGKQRPGDVTEDEQAALRSALGGSIWVARIARPGAIYDSSAADQTFTEGKIVGLQ